MSSLIPHDYRYKISSPTPVDKEPKYLIFKERLQSLTLTEWPESFLNNDGKLLCKDGDYRV